MDSWISILFDNIIIYFQDNQCSTCPNLARRNATPSSWLLSPPDKSLHLLKTLAVQFNSPFNNSLFFLLQKFSPSYVPLLFISDQWQAHRETTHQKSDILNHQIINSYMKNCEPFVSFPLLAIDKRNSLLCLTAKLSSIEKQSFQL